MRLRWTLLSIVVATAVPLVAFAVLVSTLLVRYQETNYVQAIKDRNRAFMSAVDAQLEGDIKALMVLAHSEALARDDIATFHRELVNTLAGQRGWLVIILNAADGRQLANTSFAYGTALPEPRDRDSVQQAVATGRPVIGNLIQSQRGNGYGIPVRMPVLREGAVAYVLTAVITPATFQAIITDQRLPAGWITGLIDRTGHFIARMPSREVGSQAGDAYLAAVAREREGWARMPAIDAPDTFTAHYTSDLSGWTVGIGIPASVVLGGTYRAWWMMAAGVLGSLALALAVALWLARRISRPIRQLASALPELGSPGPALVAPSTNIDELRDLASALLLASEAIREREEGARREHEAIRAADQAKDEFIAMLSHELRNPLASLVASSAVLRQAAPGSDAAVAAQGVIERQTRHMARLVEDLLDVSRIATGKAVLQPEPLDLADVLHRVVDTWRGGGRLAAHRLDVDLRETWVVADRARIEQIVSNLLDNAVKFTPPGTRIALRTRVAGAAGEIVCEDDGPGLPPGEAERMFDLFAQGAQDLSRAKGGLGIGLNLVKRLVELQQGTISVGPCGLHGGTRFTITLPGAAAQVRSPAAGTAAVARETERMQVLLVEDDEDVRGSMAALIALLGHAYMQASTGAAGVMAATRSLPDVALIDLGLPDVDGLTVARRLRALAGGDSIHLAALSGYGQAGDRARADAAGFDDYLVKPVTIEHLGAFLAAVAARRSAAAARRSAA